MLRRWTGIGNVPELPGIVSGQEKSGEHHQYENCDQDGGGHFLQGLHRVLSAKVRPARSASELAAIITRETTRVTLTMRGRSRLSAACQASWPIPGESQSASIGMAAPKEMANDTPRSARSGGAARGRTWRKNMARLPNPLARAASTWGWS